MFNKLIPLLAGIWRSICRKLLFHITQVDPLRYNLQFERFIHPERMNMPDIDIDFPWDERDKILDYIFNKYRPNGVLWYPARYSCSLWSSIREVSKVYGLAEEEIKVITKRIGYYSRPKPNW
ncbi:MAG: hypothetical protein CM1200mP10_31520 [Candidatus Neomarinimicrobiota bacterium]|nr:MAG: hypothetical protein CM1200mP10_31520 [Candidatus Neomarinimicrobiota bacterium]